MSTSEKQPTQNPEVIRDLVVPTETQSASEGDDRSPTKTERDGTTEVLAQADAAITQQVEVIRRLVVPENPSENELGNPSLSETKRGLD